MVLNLEVHYDEDGIWISLPDMPHSYYIVDKKMQVRCMKEIKEFAEICLED